jgi:hypothetical protein
VVDELRQVFEQAQQQFSDEAQRHLAAQIEAWLSEQEWDAIVSSPEGQETLERLATDARAEIARGDVEDGGWE